MEALPWSGACSGLCFLPAELLGFSVVWILIIFNDTGLIRKKSLGPGLVCQGFCFFFLPWNLLKGHCFAFAVHTRKGCQRLQGIQLPVAYRHAKAVQSQSGKVAGLCSQCGEEE